MSDWQAAQHADDDGADGHSHSWMTLREAIDAWNTVRYTDDMLDEFPVWSYFEIELSQDENLDDYRVVFWFDN